MQSEARQSMENAATALIHDAVRRVDFVEGVSASMHGLETVMREVAQSEVPVLLLAERGAGKKATARQIHDLSRRGRHAFRVVSCATLRSDQFEEWAA
jgi:DNA-binding NtrC family response regulator